MNIYEGKLVSEGIKVGVVCARFNEFIVSKLLSGCEDALLRHGVDAADISVAWVPGAFEIPLIASKLAQSGKYDAVIALGAVIRGSTSLPEQRGPRAVRGAHHRHHRAGHRARRY